MSLGNVHAVTVALGWALVHFLWQGMLMGAGCALALKLVPRKHAQARYLIAIAALAVLLALPIVTFCAFCHPGASGSGIQSIRMQARATAGAPAALSTGLAAFMTAWLAPWLPWIVAAWLAGVGVLSLRTAVGWRYLRRYRHSARPDLPHEWFTALERLRRRLAIGWRVRLAASELIGTPSVIGWIKPLILIPPSALAGLTPQQIEMILAHELAHIRRYDYLVNLFQILVETLLFYHPAVRWVSRQARREREHCCDDLAVRTCGDARGYAHALAALETTRVRKVVWSLGIADSQLVGRIERLVVAPTGSRSFPWLTMSVAVGVLLGFFVLRPASEAPPKPPVPAIRPPVQRTLAVSAQPLHIAAPSVRELVTLAPQPDNLALRQPHNDAPSATAVSHPRTSSSEPATQAKTNRASIDNKNKAAQQNDRSAKTGMPNAPPAHHHAKSPASAVPHLAGGVPVQTPPPLYPHWARERGREGSATVAFTVDTRGRVRNIRLLAVKGESAFGRAAADAVAKWRFKPFTVNGSPIAHKMTQLFDFQLKNNHRCMRTVGSRLCH